MWKTFQTENTKNILETTWHTQNLFMLDWKGAHFSDLKLSHTTYLYPPWKTPRFSKPCRTCNPMLDLYLPPWPSVWPVKLVEFGGSNDSHGYNFATHRLHWEDRFFMMGTSFFSIMFGWFWTWTGWFRILESWFHALISYEITMDMQYAPRPHEPRRLWALLVSHLSVHTKHIHHLTHTHTPTGCCDSLRFQKDQDLDINLKASHK